MEGTACCCMERKYWLSFVGQLVADTGSHVADERGSFCHSIRTSSTPFERRWFRIFSTSKVLGLGVRGLRLDDGGRGCCWDGGDSALSEYLRGRLVIRDDDVR